MVRPALSALSMQISEWLEQVAKDWAGNDKLAKERIIYSQSKKVLFAKKQNYYKKFISIRIWFGLQFMHQFLPWI